MSETVVRFEGVSVRFGVTVALDRVDLDVSSGRVVGIAGADGAGKTTLMRVAVGLVAADEGRVSVLGHDLPEQLSFIKSRLGYLPQRLGVQAHLTVRENLEYFGALNGVPPATMQARIAELLEITDLAPFRQRQSQFLSGGMRQKLALSCAVLHRPGLLLLDEPTTGVDPLSRRDVWQLIYGLLAEGASIVVATPSWEEAARCQWLIVLDHGTVLATGEPGELMEKAEGLVFELPAVPETEQRLRASPQIVRVGRHGSLLRVLLSRRARDCQPAAVLAQVLDEGELRPVSPTLEEAIVLLTRDNDT